MELLLGSHVRERGHRVGRLAGFELEPAELRIRRIIFSPDGELGPRAATRPLLAIASAGRAIELRDEPAAEALPAVKDVILISRATRVVDRGREAGRVVGVDVNPATRGLDAVFGRAHWWTRRQRLSARDVDCSQPGEIRTQNTGSSRAA